MDVQDTSGRATWSTPRVVRLSGSAEAEGGKGPGSTELINCTFDIYPSSG